MRGANPGLAQGAAQGGARNHETGVARLVGASGADIPPWELRGGRSLAPENRGLRHPPRGKPGGRGTPGVGPARKPEAPGGKQQRWQAIP